MDTKVTTPKAVPQGMVCITLDTPLNTPNGTVSTITLRRGKAKDMMAAQRAEKDPARGEILLISMLAQEKVTPEDLEELDMADLAEVQAAFQSLFVRQSSRAVAKLAGAVAGEGAVG
jgi:uncharacterized protein (DUF58 family)